MKPNKIIPGNKTARRWWLADLSRDIATSGPGVALLAIQITDLENRCRAMHRRLAAKDYSAKAKAGLLPKLSSVLHLLMSHISTDIREVMNSIQPRAKPRIGRAAPTP